MSRKHAKLVKLAKLNNECREEVELDWLVRRLLEEAQVDADLSGEYTLISICRVLEVLELVQSKQVTEVRDNTKTDHYFFIASDQLKGMMDNHPSF
jgi:hypothetical protein